LLINESFDAMRLVVDDGTREIIDQIVQSRRILRKNTQISVKGGVVMSVQNTHTIFESIGYVLVMYAAER